MNQPIEPSPDAVHSPGARPSPAGSVQVEPPLVQVIHLSELHESPPPSTALLVDTINPLYQVKARLQVCVGEATLTVGELLNAKEHQVVPLDRQLDQPVDLMLEGKVIARGQLVAVGDYFAIRITELPLPLKE